MTGPVSMAMAADGAVRVTAQAAAALVNDIQAILNAPAEIQLIKQELEDVQAVLDKLQSDESRLSILGPDTQSGIFSATEHCGEACQRFRSRIKKWTTHPSDGTMRLWDSANNARFAETEADTLSRRLMACKATVTIAMATATCFSQIRSFRTADDMKIALQSQKNGIIHQLAEINNQMGNFNQKKQQLESIRDCDSMIGETIMELQNGADGLLELRQLLDWLLASTKKEEKTLGADNILRNITADGCSRVFAGDNFQSSGKQDIRNVRATGGARVIAGRVTMSLDNFYD